MAVARAVMQKCRMGEEPPRDPEPPRPLRTPSGRWVSPDHHRSATRIIQRRSAGMLVIYEHIPDADDPAPRALVFESAEFTIRLTKYPADWHEMTDAQLIVLCRS